MTLVASRLAAEQLVSQFFLRRELVRSCLDVVVFGCERTHLWRELVCGDRQGEAVICMLSPRSVRHAEMDWVLIIRGWRPGNRTDFFHAGRPLNVERVRPPHRLKKFAIRKFA